MDTKDGSKKKKNTHIILSDGDHPKLEQPTITSISLKEGFFLQVALAKHLSSATLDVGLEGGRYRSSEGPAT